VKSIQNSQNFITRILVFDLTETFGLSSLKTFLLTTFCAPGFPCQNYSKAGDQLGPDCPKWGDLVTYIVRILNHHQPRILIMENVPNLMRHEGGETWKGIRRKLMKAGYEVSESKLSPDSRRELDVL
jgi:hypothetical protein